MKARKALGWVTVVGAAWIAMAIVVALLGASDTPTIVFWLMGAILCVAVAAYMMYRFYQLLLEIRESIQKLQDERERKAPVCDLTSHQDTKLCATAVGIADKWKNKALQNLQASIQCGKVDEAKGHALMQYVQSITGNPHNVQHGNHT